MDLVMGKGKKKGLINKTWERCKSIGGGSKSSGIRPVLTKKSKSWPRIDIREDEEKPVKKHRVAPEGCFSVYVGTQKQRFVIKTEYANHPLFKMLLEEAESEYGYNSEGPLALPCDVDLFYRVLVEMDSCDQNNQGGCTFARSSRSYRLLTPSRLVAMNS
ncbi:unnamed protein product [Ilex paraguariensis]|uniref:Small auxin up regulated protein n=1 Tax=Ilex paraguariensis TaxID=185542 RepID=A0ABC8RQQ6_9AQUA